MASEKGMNIMKLSHDKAYKLIESYIEDRMSPGRRADMEEHINTCGVCCEEVEKLQRAQQAVESFKPSESIPPAVLNAAWDKIEEEANRETLGEKLLSGFSFNWKTAAAFACMLLVTAGIFFAMPRFSPGVSTGTGLQGEQGYTENEFMARIITAEDASGSDSPRLINLYANMLSSGQGERF